LHQPIERQNLSIRMGMRRMTRLTNAFSEKWRNLKAAYALWFAWFNFCRVHKRLRVTPAMEAGITDRIWEIDELLAQKVVFHRLFTGVSRSFSLAKTTACILSEHMVTSIIGVSRDVR